MSGTAALVAQGITHSLGNAVSGGALTAEYEKPGGVFRPLQEMLYPPLIAPYVHAATLLVLAKATHTAAPQLPILALAAWLGTAHGIFIDWTTYKTAAVVPCVYGVMTLVGALVQGAVLSRVL